MLLFNYETKTKFGQIKPIFIIVQEYMGFYPSGELNNYILAEGEARGYRGCKPMVVHNEFIRVAVISLKV